MSHTTPPRVRFAPEYAISVQLIGEYNRQNDNDPNQSELMEARSPAPSTMEVR